MKVSLTTAESPSSDRPQIRSAICAVSRWSATTICHPPAAETNRMQCLREERLRSDRARDCTIVLFGNRERKRRPIQDGRSLEMKVTKPATSDWSELSHSDQAQSCSCPLEPASETMIPRHRRRPVLAAQAASPRSLHTRELT